MRLQQYDPEVARLAEALGTQPETALTRLEKHLPSRIEQGIFLKFGADFKLDPETGARMFHVLRLSDPMEEFYGQNIEVGENLIVNPAESLEDRFKISLDLLSEVTKQIDDIDVSEPTACALVWLFDDCASTVVSDLVSSISISRELFGIPESHPDSVVIRSLITFTVRCALLDRAADSIVSNNGYDYIERLETVDDNQLRQLTVPITWDDLPQ